MNAFKVNAKGIAAGAFAMMSVMALPAVVVAEDAPFANVAEPGVYKLVAEDENFRVLVMTWQPGQKDAFHSHTANAVYHLTDCDRKIFRPDGTVAKEGSYKAGSAVLQKPVSSHSFQNVSDHVCQSVMVERK